MQHNIREKKTSQLSKTDKNIIVQAQINGADGVLSEFQ